MTSNQKPIQSAFSETSDPGAYVPRADTESALEEILSWSKASHMGSSVVALVSQPGLGKTLLLRVVESRIALRRTPSDVAPRTLYLPYAGLSLTDLCLWVHGLLGIAPIAGVPEGDPQIALAALMALAQGPEDPFFLLLDDADSMPTETARLLAQELPRERSPLRIVMAINDDARASRLLAALDPLEPSEVRFRKPMNQVETDAYLRGRLRHAGFSESVIDGIETGVVARLHALSGGVPRRLHGIVESVFDSNADRLPSELDEKRRREDWMGRPLDDDL